MRLARTTRIRLGRFHAEHEPRRGEHGHHRPCHSLLEPLAGLSIDPLGDRHQPVERPVVDRPAECSGREPAQDLAGVLASLRIRLGRFVLEEEPVVVLRARPVLGIQRPLDLDRDDPNIERLAFFSAASAARARSSTDGRRR